MHKPVLACPSHNIVQRKSSTIIPRISKFPHDRSAGTEEKAVCLKKRLFLLVFKFSLEEMRTGAEKGKEVKHRIVQVC